MSNEQEKPREELTEEQKEAFDSYVRFCMPYVFLLCCCQGLPAMIEGMAKAEGSKSESTNQA